LLRDPTLTGEDLRVFLAVAQRADWSGQGVPADQTELLARHAYVGETLVRVSLTKLCRRGHLESVNGRYQPADFELSWAPRITAPGGVRRPRGDVPAGKRFRVFTRDRFTCRYCGAQAPTVRLEVDHVVPLSSGGASGFDNLVTACADCNRGKSDSVVLPPPRIDEEGAR
jgi:5-methylcytosine-specific restriction endonuclease McrA